MARVYTSSDIDFILEGLSNRCAYKMKAQDGFEFWLLPDGESSNEPHLNLSDLVYVKPGVPPDLLKGIMQAKAKLLVKVRGIGGPKKAAPKKKAVW